MSNVAAESEIQVLRVEKSVVVEAPLQVVWETLLEQPTPHAMQMQLKLEPWVGGRWFRDLGNGAGHLWGHVQVIKPPKLLELIGPMFMSYPVASHIQYRLSEEGKAVKLTLLHQAIGLINEEHRSGVSRGWQEVIEAIRGAAEGKGKK